MRYPSIDILRTFAIVVMVLVHFGENLSGYTSPITGFGAPLFAFLSGVSYFLWVQGQIARGVSEEDISKVSIRRGLFVFGFGFAFNILVWLPEDTFNWDVLTFVGTALLLLNGFRRIPLPIAVLTAVIAVLISPILRGLADYDAYWPNKYFEHDFTLSDVVIGFLCTGYFPLFPWIAFSLSGYATAATLFVETEPEELPPSPWPLIGLGAALMTMSLVALSTRTYLPEPLSKHFFGGWKMFPPTIEYVLATLGLTLMLLGLTHRFVDRNPAIIAGSGVIAGSTRGSRWQGLLNVAKTFSRYSFTIYVLHHVVHLWPLWLYGLANGVEPTYFWMKVMPLTTSITLAFVFLASCYLILSRLGPDRTYGIESWMRWLCD